MHTVDGQSPLRARRHCRGQVNCVCVCVLNACEPGCVKSQRTSGCWAWSHVGFILRGSVMDYSNSVFWTQTVFRFVLFMYMLSTKSSISAHWHVVQSGRVKRIRSLPHHLDVVHSTPDSLLLSSSTLFPPQLTASTREMSDSLCQRCLASSNICEVLSSSLQLRRTLSQGI